MHAVGKTAEEGCSVGVNFTITINYSVSDNGNDIVTLTDHNSVRASVSA